MLSMLGTSTYYRYDPYKPLAEDILGYLLQMKDVKNFGMFFTGCCCADIILELHRFSYYSPLLANLISSLISSRLIPATPFSCAITLSL